ncbi:MAG TPA: DUF5069 domain-containing protein [Opitutaceae bacterium]|jgi:gluconokinase|nr:DUF5069 domain-containing protein [Opitutaceae bacterium]
MGATLIPGLRSPYDTVGGIVHFGRMLDKIRLHRQGKLPPAWVELKGDPKGFDGQCCRFLRIDHAQLEAETLRGRTDGEMLAWAFGHGRKPDDYEIETWNGFLSRRCWRDAHTDRLHFRLKESGFPVGAALTMFDYIDLDEGRPLRHGTELPAAR